MFIILTYDVNQKRVGKMLKICRKYLLHVQRSVFEGVITEGKLNKLKNEIKNIIDDEEDMVCVYKMDSLKYTKKEQLGVVEEFSYIL